MCKGGVGGVLLVTPPAPATPSSAHQWLLPDHCHLQEGEKPTLLSQFLFSSLCVCERTHFYVLTLLIDGS